MRVPRIRGRQSPASRWGPCLLFAPFPVALMTGISSKHTKKHGGKKGDAQESPSTNSMPVIIWLYFLQIFHVKRINEKPQIWLNPKHTHILLPPRRRLPNGGGGWVPSFKLLPPGPSHGCGRGVRTGLAPQLEPCGVLQMPAAVWQGREGAAVTLLLPSATPSSLLSRPRPPLTPPLAVPTRVLLLGTSVPPWQGQEARATAAKEGSWPRAAGAWRRAALARREAPTSRG